MTVSIVLPATKGNADRLCLWTPSTLLALAGVGVLELREAKKIGGNPAVRRYLVKELPGKPSKSGSGLPDRVFEFTKAGAVEDDEKRYVCLKAGMGFDECTCKGFMRGGKCAHQEAMRFLLTQGHLPPVITAATPTATGT